MSTTNDVYKNVPIFENSMFLLRQVDKTTDSDDLLEVYSDQKALPLFNSDNCHGDIFYYNTKEKMDKALDFWDFSYQNRYFVRWAIIDKNIGKAIGTIELFHRDAQDWFSNCGVLRLDLHSAYETERNITYILSLIISDTYEMFYCDKIATKAVNAATERICALKKLGFEKSNQNVIGNDGKTLYGDYYVLTH
jgi:hypothetical protein